MNFEAGSYQTIVIGAGHAGCEAGLASARLGLRTLLLTLNMDHIALMPCNPSIGGPAKGHLVREIDALGGDMAKVTDRTLIQVRMLNTRKGPAVRALRAQVDKEAYQQEMRKQLFKEDNLHIKQAMVDDILIKEGAVVGVHTSYGAIYRTENVIITSGTYLKGRIILGDLKLVGGPQGQQSAEGLTASLQAMGLKTGRFKTGTPARIDGRTVDYSKLERQDSDPKGWSFSFEDQPRNKKMLPCYLTTTNEKTHQVIRDNIDRAPLYSGIIDSLGPRYCPSVEDKVMRFKDKTSHPIFVEPEGYDSSELYIQGLSTSMPLDVQMAMFRTMPGLEKAEIIRPAYAIEYDYVEPTQLKASLETLLIEGLFCAGQINGTSGYEEAAAQGLVAGINAAMRSLSKPPLILDRASSYIGVLIDDLVTKGTNEPYRMFTARSEYRLLLRQDNADQRLTPIGYELGLISQDRYQAFLAKDQAVKAELSRLEDKVISPKEAGFNDYLISRSSSPIDQGYSLGLLLKRPELDYELIESFCPPPGPLSQEVKDQVVLEIKYAGYIRKQEDQVARFHRLEKKLIPEDFDYQSVRGLTSEARQKLLQLKPLSIGQASRISGVSPADINVLLVHLEKARRSEDG